MRFLLALLLLVPTQDPPKILALDGEDPEFPDAKVFYKKQVESGPPHRRNIALAAAALRHLP